MVSQIALDGPDSYAIAWITALPIERAAAEAMLDEEHAAPTGFTRHQADANVYTWGRVGEHNVVIASLAAGDYGTTSAATTASNLLASLPSIRVGLLVGIGGGIARPDEGYDIRLGDIVVSQPSGTIGGVCQYDLIKAKPGDKRELKGFLGRPPTVLLNALTGIQANHERKDSKVSCFLQEMLEKNPKMRKRSRQSPGYAHQGFNNDRLFKAFCDHVPGPDCRGCDTADEVQREPRDTTDPVIHYGIIASGNTLVKDAAARDRIVADLGEDCICFEMEASGLMNHFPCLVIRGICDYADSHKNDRWQRYASASAAAYAKELLAYVPVTEVQETKRVLEVLQLVQQQIDSVRQTTVATKATTDSIRSDLRTDKIRVWLNPPDPSTNANHARTLRHEGSGSWLLENPLFQSWQSGSRRHLWLHGLAGCGKTVLSATVLDYLAKGNDGLILSFFFDFSDIAKQTWDGMLRSLAFQLYQGGVNSASHLDALFQAHRNGRDQPTIQALSGIVFTMLVDQRKVFIVLDALDESKTRDDVILWIKDVISRLELAHVQLLYTSRPEYEFLHHIPPLIGEQNCLPVDKEAVNFDIQSWVTAQLSQRRDFTEKPLSQGLLEEIRKKVGGGADGMFRWAFCQMDSLARCRHEASMEEALASLPLNLNETYERMMESIPTEGIEDIVQMTVKFLEKEATFQRWARLYQADVSWKGYPGPPRGSRLYYACFDGLVAPARELIGKGVDVNAQGGLYGNALQAASYKGYQEIVKLLLGTGADINAQGGENGSALQAASHKGYQEIVKLLLGKVADGCYKFDEDLTIVNDEVANRLSQFLEHIFQRRKRSLDEVTAGIRLKALNSKVNGVFQPVTDFLCSPSILLCQRPRAGMRISKLAELSCDVRIRTSGYWATARQLKLAYAHKLDITYLSFLCKPDTARPMAAGIVPFSSAHVNAQAAKAWAEAKPVAESLPKPRDLSVARFFTTDECNALIEEVLKEATQGVMCPFQALSEKN
ncbi:hypothetical protein KXV84_001497 [Aspergillus fumigatus]|nr:hypothetical protein KXX69_003735 [Aspergillus fumigatus]KAH3560087.1 hypothetical protein KXV84_001497 [Aspergillus fumigatus]